MEYLKPMVIAEIGCNHKGNREIYISHLHS